MHMTIAANKNRKPGSGKSRALITPVTARLLQSAGMIRYRRGHIQVIDRAGLEDAACECYAAIREHADEVFSPSAAVAG